MEIVRLKLSDLEPNAGQIDGLPVNPRQWTKTDLDSLALSLRETPELFEARPIIVVPNGDKYVILGGNLRFEASRLNKADTVPCVVIPAETPIDKLKEIVIKDNGSWGSWDYDALANEWDDLNLSDWGVPTWDTRAFSPNLNPVDGITPVTEADIKKRQDALDGQFTDPEQNMAEITCPHCGGKFFIKA